MPVDNEKRCCRALRCENRLNVRIQHNQHRAAVDQSAAACSNIVIVNSRFLECPQKRSRGREPANSQALNQNKIDRQDPESQAGRESDGYGRWCLELRRGRRYGEEQLEAWTM